MQRTAPMHFLFRCICLRRSTPAVPGHFLVSPVVGPAAFHQVPMGSQTYQIREKNSMNIYHAPQEFQPGTHSLKRSRGSGLFHTAASQPSVFRSTRHLIRQCVSCHPQRHIYSASFPLHVIICRRQSASCLPPAFNVQHNHRLPKYCPTNLVTPKSTSFPRQLLFYKIIGIFRHSVARIMRGHLHPFGWRDSDSFECSRSKNRSDNKYTTDTLRICLVKETKAHIIVGLLLYAPVKILTLSSDKYPLTFSSCFSSFSSAAAAGAAPPPPPPPPAAGAAATAPPEGTCHPML